MEALTPIYGPRPRCKRNRQRDVAVCANLSRFDLKLSPRAIMDIRPLLSSITRRPQEGPWRRTRLQKCRWNRFSIRPFRLANLGGMVCYSDRIVDLPPSRVWRPIRCGPGNSLRSHGLLRACSRPSARVLRPTQQPVHSNGAASMLPPARLRSRAWPRFGASAVRLWLPE